MTAASRSKRRNDIRGLGNGCFKLSAKYQRLLNQAALDDMNDTTFRRPMPGYLAIQHMERRKLVEVIVFDQGTADGAAYPAALIRVTELGWKHVDPKLCAARRLGKGRKQESIAF